MSTSAFLILLLFLFLGSKYFKWRFKEINERDRYIKEWENFLKE